HMLRPAALISSMRAGSASGSVNCSVSEAPGAGFGATGARAKASAPLAPPSPGTSVVWSGPSTAGALRLPHVSAATSSYQRPAGPTSVNVVSAPAHRYVVSAGGNVLTVLR